MAVAGRLRAGFALWWSLGPVTGTKTAARAVHRVAEAPVRRWRLRFSPPGVSPRELEAALGGRPRAEVLAAALPALPSVARWREHLEAGRAGILARAEDIARHRFDLLGSGPTELGSPIDWQRDFKTGRTWPLRHVSEIVISYPDDSDIKVPWELSRFQHLPLLAAAHELTGDSRWTDEIGAQLTDFIEANPVEFGACWACTMDVAIRAANWTATLALLGDAAARQPWIDDVLGSLLLHGRFIRSHLEWTEYRGNHYLADIAGLEVLSAVFRGSREGDRWAHWAAGELAAEMEHQVRPDGVDHEASIPYHRLVAEMFVVAADAARELAPGALPAAFEQRLGRMLQFAADVARPDGLAPSVGDDDSGRFLPLGDYGGGRDLRDHSHLFVQAGRPAPSGGGHAAYPDGGYWVMRAGEAWVLVRCGDVGIYGRGCHAHNDALSFELAFAGRLLVADPGSYLYTADPDARNRFRSVRSHSTLQLDDAEPNPISRETLFVLEDHARAELLEWAPPVFVGRHHGYAPAIHERRFELDGALTITDVVRSPDSHALTWTFPLAHPRRVDVTPRGAVADFGDVVLEIEADREDVVAAVEDGWLSPAYGVRDRAPVLRLRATSRAGEDTTRIWLRTSLRAP